MLTIEGNSYAEVFRNLAACPEYTDAERAAALIVAEDLEAEASWRLGYEDARDADQEGFMSDPTWNAWYAAHNPKPVARHHSHRPLDTECVFDVNGTRIRFVVRPYTSGQTMNVGVTTID